MHQDPCDNQLYGSVSPHSVLNSLWRSVSEVSLNVRPLSQTPVGRSFAVRRDDKNSRDFWLVVGPRTGRFGSRRYPVGKQGISLCKRDKKTSIRQVKRTWGTLNSYLKQHVKDSRPLGPSCPLPFRTRTTTHFGPTRSERNRLELRTEEVWSSEPLFSE